MRRLSLLLLVAVLAPAQTTVVLLATKDNTLYENFIGSLSNGSGDGVFVGKNNGSFSPVIVRRGLVAFDVAASVPAGATILSAELQMVLVADSGGSHPVALHRVLADWGEGPSVALSGGGGGGPAYPGDATWVHRFFPGDPWATPGGDFSASVSATQSVGGFPGTFITWSSTPQLVADVQAWVDAPASDFGWLLKAPENGGANARKLASRESFYPPVLIVTYQAPMAGLTPVGTGCAGSAPTPLTLTGNGLPTLGNLAFALELSGGPAGAPASLFIADATSPTPFPLTTACAVHVDLASAAAYVQAGLSPLATLRLDAQGATSFPIPLPNAALLAGFGLAFQAVVTDPPAPGGLVSSNALGVVIGY